MKEVKRQNGKSWKNPRIQILSLLVKNSKLYISIFYCSLSIAVTREKEGYYPKYILWNSTLTLFDTTPLLVSCFKRKFEDLWNRGVGKIVKFSMLSFKLLSMYQKTLVSQSVSYLVILKQLVLKGQFSIWGRRDTSLGAVGSSLKRTRTWYQTTPKSSSYWSWFFTSSDHCLRTGMQWEAWLLTASAFFIYDRSNTTTGQPLIEIEQLQDMLQGSY